MASNASTTAVRLQNKLETGPSSTPTFGRLREPLIDGHADQQQLQEAHQNDDKVAPVEANLMLQKPA